jgi:hypothetical protein
MAWWVGTLIGLFVGYALGIITWWRAQRAAESGDRSDLW